MKSHERLSKAVILCAGLVLLLGMQDRLASLLLVNRLSIEQMRGESRPPEDVGRASGWYLVDYVAGRGLASDASYASAIPLLERALARGGKVPPVLLELGLAHLREGSLKDALEYLRQVPGIGGSEKFNYLVDLGWSEVLRNRDLPPGRQDWSLAERYYQAAVSVSPGSRLAHRALIELYVYWAPNWSGAREALREAELQFPNWKVGEAYGVADTSEKRGDAAGMSSQQVWEGKSEDTDPRTEGASSPGAVEFAAPGRWSDPLLIFQTDGKINHPFVVADDAGTVHCLWTVNEPSRGHNFGIYYASLRGSVWTRALRVHRDSWIAFVTALPLKTGSLMVIWSGPENKLVSRSLELTGPQDSRAWSAPKTVARGRGSSDLGQDATGRIHYVFPGRPLGIFHQLSGDNGRFWTERHIVEETRGRGVKEPVLAIDPGETLHLVWTEYELPKGWPPRGVFYSQSRDLGKSWSPSFRIADPGYDQGVIVALSENELHVVFNGMAGIGGRYHRFSRDGGRNWSPVTQISKEGATNGLSRLVADRHGKLRLLTTSGERVLYGSYAEGRWTPLSEVSSGSVWRDQVAMTLEGGRVVHAIYWEEQTHLYHRALILEDAVSARSDLEAAE